MNRKTVPKNGMFGAMVVVIGITLAIFGTYLLDVDTETHEVTKYNYLTDVLGLFAYNNSPQYVDYDLASNYTGYYTQASDPYVDGITYNTTKVNRYLLKFEPTSQDSSTEDLSQGTFTDKITPSGSYNGLTVMMFGENGTSNPLWISSYPIENMATGSSSDPYNIALDDILDAYGLRDYETVTITPVSDAIEDRILFTTTSDYTNITATSTYASYGFYATDTDSYSRVNYMGKTVDVLKACLSCTVNTITGNIDYYSTTTPSPETWVRSVSLSDACVIFGGENTYSGVDGFGTRISIDSYNSPDPQYLDIQKGIRVVVT